jgi:hypothetical protein
MMHEHEKFDRRVVPTKPPNNGVGWPLQGPARPKPAEAVEGRRLAKSHPQLRAMFRTQRWVDMSPELERRRQAARRDRKTRFTALLHHVSRLDTLRRASVGLHPKAAPGVDGVTWQPYGEDVEAHLQDLAGRLA